MNVDIENIDSKHFGDQYMKLLKTHILKKQIHFQQHFKTNVEIIQMNLRTYYLRLNQL